MYRIGVDIGGTFTDFALVETASGRTRLHKRLTTPQDPAQAVIDGIAALVTEANLAFSDIEAVVHGTTLVTNALIQRRGAPTGILVTMGMRDRFEIGRETRYDLFDLRLRFPEPLVPRALRREVTERILADGSIETALDQDGLLASAAELIEAGAQSLAICFLNSWRNPAHEQAATSLLAKHFPQVFTSASADVFPAPREFERWTTTVMNAYVQPVVDLYIGDIEARLAALGFAGRFQIMSSSGAMLTPDLARRFPIRLLESGPAAGVLMSAHHARHETIDALLSFDMGGTTAKGALVRGGLPMKRDTLEVARLDEFRPGSGLPAKAPVIDLIEIGAGGGSIAGIDLRGLIQVGPHSAGAAPGPACYGLGGDQPTLTDANLLLGYLGADSFLGGAMALDPKSARAAITSKIAQPLGLEILRAAWGIHETINEAVARAFRVHASERGFDYRRATLVAFGGSGPIHACRIARKLGIPRLLLPQGAGVMSALGLLQSPYGFDLSRRQLCALKGLSAADFAAGFAPLEAEVSARLAEAGVAPAQMRLRRLLELRFVGQGYEIEIEPGPEVANLRQLFLERYRAVFGSAPEGDPIELVTWRIEGLGPPPLAEMGFVFDRPSRSGGASQTGSRQIFTAESGMVTAPVHDRYRLQQGQELVGPAVIEERESTLILGPGDRASCDDFGNLHVAIADPAKAADPKGGCK